jgi:hypothetical protein
MTVEELETLFEKHHEEHGEFQKVKKPRSKRADLNALMLIDSLVTYDESLGDSEDIISASEHDQAWISIEPERLAPFVTEEQVIELIRCGIRYDREHDAFCFFT